MKRKLLIGIAFLSGVGLVRYFAKKTSLQQEEWFERELKGMQRKYEIMKKWHMLHGKSISTFFYNNQYHHIAVYGIGELGTVLIDEVNNFAGDLHICYGIDANKSGSRYKNIPIYGLNSDLPEADVIVITPVLDCDTIKQRINEKTNIPIVTLDEVLSGTQCE